MSTYKTIAESNNFIVLDKYIKQSDLGEPSVAYQSEAALEREFIEDLTKQGYENPLGINTAEAMLAISNVQIELKDLKAARKTLEDLIAAYPQADTAGTARDRLSRLR
jgi:type I restriction enzyme R subunit